MGSPLSGPIKNGICNKPETFGNPRLSTCRARLRAAQFAGAWSHKNEICSPTKFGGQTMKPNQLATLVLRLLGIYSLIQSIPLLDVGLSMIALVQAKQETAGIGSVVTAGLPFICMVLVGILLIMFSTSLGEELTRDLDDANIAVASFSQFQVVAVALVGVLIFASALPHLFNSVIGLINWVRTTGADRKNSPLATTYTARNIFTAIGYILEGALGLWMFLGARGFTEIWRSLREFGTPKSQA